MNVLALQLKRIGDLALTTPALHAMRTAGAHVTLALTESTAALLPALGDSVDEALVYHARGVNFPLWKHLARGRFDACVDFTGRDRSALMALASRAPRRVIAGQSLRKGRWRRLLFNSVVNTSVRSRHTVDLYLDHLAGIPLPVPPSDEPPAPILRLPPESIAAADQRLAAAGIGAGEPFVVIHPGSARPEKYWLPERWAEVIGFCQREMGRRCVLTGGGNDPFENEHLARIRAALGPQDRQSCADLAGRLDLLSLAATLARAALVVSVDSGPMHLAAAFRRPQIALFGPTNPFHWRPRHRDARVLRASHGDLPLTDFPERSPGGTLDLISTRAVIDCIRQLPLVADSPC